MSASPTRGLIVVGLLAVVALAVPAAERRFGGSLDVHALPYTIGDWRGSDAAPLDAATIDELGLDAYITRTYRRAGIEPLGLFVAYYDGSRPGPGVHSPLNCLPGTGWETLDVGTRRVLESDGTTTSLRRIVARKNLSRAIVLYGYDIHGRIAANEIASRAYLLADAFRLRRRDAALVRVVAPVTESPEAAERQALAFVRDLLPAWSRLWS